MVTDILCQIHYCKGQKLKDPGKVVYGVTRTYQHHEMIFVCEGKGHIVIGGKRYPIIIAAPRLGKLSDKIGAHKVIMISLIVAGVLYIPQAFVQNPWQLLVLRFLLGFAMGGLIPSVSIMIKKITPDNLTGRIFGFNMSLGYLGVAAGSVLGGQIAGRFSFQYVFYVTSALMFINAVWVYFRVYKKWGKVDLKESLGKN